VSIVRVTALGQQPTEGSIEQIPLAGDGRTAPASAYVVDFHITGDASGGFVHMSVTKDPRYQHLVQLLSLESDSATAVLYRFDLFRTDLVAFHQIGTTDTITLASTLVNVVWTPPAIIAPSKWAGRMVNGDGDLHKFKCIVYNFDIEAMLKTPLPILFASLPRAASVN